MIRFPKRTLGLAVTAVSLASAASAVAQTPMQQHNQAHVESGTETHQGGFVQGTVQGIDFGLGLITIRSTTGLITLQAEPTQLMGFKQGDSVGLPYTGTKFRWLGRDVGTTVSSVGSSGYGAPYAKQGTIIGTVDAIDDAIGHVTVDVPGGKVLLHGHPTLLRGVLPGLYAKFEVVEMGGDRWIGAVQPASGQAVGGSGQNPPSPAAPGTPSAQ